MLTVDTLPAYLLEERLIAPDAVLDGDLEVVTRSRRNRNLRVTWSQGGFLVKQPEEAAGPAGETLRREAALYAYVQGDERLTALRPFLPPVVRARPEAGVLVLGLLRDAVPLWTHYERSTAARFPVETAAEVGRALARVHHAFAGAEPDFLPDALPWAFALHRPSPSVRAGVSRAALEVVRIVQADAEMVAAVDTAAAGWRADSVVHGDVKLDNVLVREDGGGVCLVDWELVQLGDAAWDVAGALHDFLVWWIVTMPQAPTVEEMAERARFPLPALQPGIAALWRGYRDAARAGEPPAAILRRAVPYVGVRLVQTAYEMAANVHALPAPSVLALQVAWHVLRDPEAALEGLMGIGAGEVRT
ncbi:MAG TPA: aminoglycoside phosphotransferase family protein [Longimicrobium sp.]|jgi:aminoglycoside phosphotransferase (APT) family kinase protein